MERVGEDSFFLMEFGGWGRGGEGGIKNCRLNTPNKLQGL